MQCKQCRYQAVLSDPQYCKTHFISYFENKVNKTITTFKLLNKNDTIVVAVSGGKDSLTLLYLLNKWYKQVKALAIDEGIHDYRVHTLKTLKLFCKQYKIRLEIVSYKKEFGNSLDNFLKQNPQMKPCTLCGAFRRYLLNKKARELRATKLATGHNLDDEAQVIIMNLLRASPSQSARLGPSSGIIKDKRFIPRVKPLYLCTEKEVTIYSFLMNFNIKYGECPNVSKSIRYDVVHLLNEYEQEHKGTKLNIIKTFLHELPKLKKTFSTEQELGTCLHCGEPANTNICKTCLLLEQIKKKITCS